jgi:hypothetical protein
MFLVLLPESVNASLLKQALKKLRNILLSPWVAHGLNLMKYNESTVR